MPKKSIAIALLFSIITSLTSPLALATSTPPEAPEANTGEVNETPDAESMGAALSLSSQVKFIELALSYSNQEMVLKFLRSADIDLWNQLLADENRASRILRQIATRGNVEVASAFLDLAVRQPANARNIFAPGNNGFTALHAAALGGHAQVARLLLDFAFTHPSYAERILAPTHHQITALHAATQGGHVEVVRALLESPFYARFLLDSPVILPLPDDQERARAVAATILEYAPRFDFTQHEPLRSFGELEAFVMAMNVQRVHELLAQGRLLENNGELLAAMLRNTRSFDREQMRTFIGALETMRREMLAPRRQERGRVLLEQALLNLPLALVELPLPQNVQALDQIIAVIRSRLLPNLQTLGFEAFDRAVRSIGEYGGRGQFANEESASNIIRSVRDPSAPHLIDGVLPGARLFASELLPYLFSYFLNQYRAFPGANK